MENGKNSCKRITPRYVSPGLKPLISFILGLLSLFYTRWNLLMEASYFGQTNGQENFEDEF